jgi:hypothetical protein
MKAQTIQELKEQLMAKIAFGNPSPEVIDQIEQAIDEAIDAAYDMGVRN